LPGCGERHTIRALKAPAQAQFLAVVIAVALALSACGTESEVATPATMAPATAPAPTLAPAPTPTQVGDPGGTKVVVDTDMSTDDLMALAMLLGSPQVEVAAVTIVGAFVRCPRGEQVMLGYLASLGVSGVPVACGPPGPLEGNRAFPRTGATPPTRPGACPWHLPPRHPSPVGVWN